jgi:hypothetical protein
MSHIPTPIRAALGLAATALDEARRLPETLPQAATTVPMTVITTAMQTSLKVQQRIAELAVRGDAVISQLRGTSPEPPTWATFDDAPAEAEASNGKAAFDRIDYDTGYDDGEDETTGEADSETSGRPGRWDAVGVGGTPPEDLYDDAPLAAPTEIPPAAAPKKKAPAKKAAKTVAEPIEVVAEKAKPSATPNPATMAAEIVHAHEVAEEAADDAAEEADLGD